MSHINFSHVSLKPSDINVVLYHSPCVDGFGSAFAAMHYFKIHNIHNVRFIPCSHGKSPPDLLNQNVLICDFSYKYPILENILSSCKNLLILDHHLTAQNDLVKIPEKNKVFVMNHSGAYITWSYFFGENTVPLFIRYIEDNDIWKKELHFTKEFTSFISIEKMEYNSYVKYLDVNYIQNVAFPCGAVLLKQNEEIINDTVKKCTVNFIEFDQRYYLVAECNTSVLKSDIGNKLFEVEPFINFSSSYSLNPETKQSYISLRSIDTASDTTLISTKFGGGGHRNASGFTSYSIGMPCRIIDTNNINKELNKIGYNESHNIAFLNMTSHKHSVLKYLQQIRVIKNDLNITELQHILNVKFNKMYDVKFIVLYCYNDSTNEINFLIGSKTVELLLNLYLGLKQSPLYFISNNPEQNNQYLKQIENLHLRFSVKNTNNITAQNFILKFI